MNAKTAFEKYREKLFKSYAMIAVAVIVLEAAVYFIMAKKIIASKTIALLLFNAAAALFIIIAGYEMGVVLLECRREIIERQNLLEKQVQCDQMTGLYNHDAFYKRLLSAMKEADAAGSPLALAVMDIDDFKLVNDRYGHKNGDVVLIALAKIIMKYCGGKNDAFRYGGEEFAVIFKNTEIDDAKHIVAGILEEFAGRGFRFASSPMTFSCGICLYNFDGETPDAFFGRADSALYAAKADGKNRITEM